MKAFLAFLVITIFISFTVQGQERFEKRKFRPGYYIAPISHRHLHHQQADSPIIEKKTNINKAENVSENPLTVVDTSDLAFGNKIIPSKINNLNKSTDTIIINNFKGNLDKASLLERINGNMNEGYASKSSTLELNTQRSFDSRFGITNNEGGKFLAAIVILLLMLIIASIFPTLTLQEDKAIAEGIIIITAIIISLLKGDLKFHHHNRRAFHHHFKRPASHH
jgi:hypothetical protein